MRQIKKIIIHCTDSNWGNVSEIKRWHLERGFGDIGYHYVIYNGYPTYKSWKDKEYSQFLDGYIASGRPVELPGSHCLGHNHDSIGVALVGVKDFTEAQFKSCSELIEELLKTYGLTQQDVYPHNFFNPQKTCPNFDIKLLFQTKPRQK